MPYRDVTMVEIKEVLRLWLEGMGIKPIAAQPPASPRMFWPVSWPFCTVFPDDPGGTRGRSASSTGSSSGLTSTTGFG
jgi:hypothetical protein